MRKVKVDDTFYFFQTLPYLGPIGFVDFPLRERAAKRRERKTFRYHGLGSHFCGVLYPLCQTDRSEISRNTRGKWNDIFD